MEGEKMQISFLERCRATVIGIGHPICQNDRLGRLYAWAGPRPAAAAPRPAIPQKPIGKKPKSTWVFKKQGVEV